MAHAYNSSRQEDCELETSLGYIIRPCLKTIKIINHLALHDLASAHLIGLLLPPHFRPTTGVTFKPISVSRKG
jgi:hypothetical protein